MYLLQIVQACPNQWDAPTTVAVHDRRHQDMLAGRLEALAEDCRIVGADHEDRRLLQDAVSKCLQAQCNPYSANFLF